MSEEETVDYVDRMETKKMSMKVRVKVKAKTKQENSETLSDSTHSLSVSPNLVMEENMEIQTQNNFHDNLWASN
jgi:hypothetical protein